MINILNIEINMQTIEVGVSIPPYENIVINIVGGDSDTELMNFFYYDEWDKVWSKLLNWPDSDIKYIPTDPNTVRYDSSRAEISISKFSDDAVLRILLAYEVDSQIFVELDVKTWEILHVYSEGKIED